MKKSVILIITLLLSIFLTACGEKEEEESSWRGIEPGMDDLTAVTERSEYYDIAVDKNEIFDLGLWEKNPQDQNVYNAAGRGNTVYIPLGTQFLKGETVQIWAEVSSKGSDIYLYKGDVSSELLLQNISNDYVASRTPSYQWYIDQNGDFYCYGTYYPYADGEYRAESLLEKIHSSGEFLYENTMEPGIAMVDNCQTEDGRIYLLLRDEAEDSWSLAEADPATGKIIPNYPLLISIKFLGCLLTGIFSVLYLNMCIDFYCTDKVVPQHFLYVPDIHILVQ